MIIWVDAQLPPTFAAWLVETFGVTAFSLKELGLRDAKDTEIFEAARQPNLVIMSNDSDFVDLICRLGSPPQIILSGVDVDDFRIYGESISQRGRCAIDCWFDRILTMITYCLNWIVDFSNSLA